PTATSASSRSPPQNPIRDPAGQRVTFGFETLLQILDLGPQRRLSLSGRRFGPRARVTQTRRPLFLQIAALLLEFLVRLGARSSQSRLILGCFLVRFCQARLSQLPRPLGRVIPLA